MLCILIIGLFVLTPFPSLEVFRCVPLPPFPHPLRRKHILDAVLGANLTRFQTCTRHFTSACVRVCGFEITCRGGIVTSASVARGASVVPCGAGGRGAGVEKYVGINVQGHVGAVICCPPASPQISNLNRSPLRAPLRQEDHRKKKRQVGCCQGSFQKLRAFEKLLHDYPE
ncbi:hypothetical protein EDB19DRAFT_1705216 [Suillus lakei]|nr:hypothetical protein EDB19DRAFT_1705216 [Suillus lakei]